MRAVELRAGAGRIAMTAFLPDLAALSGCVIFAAPGGGYSRGYYNMRFDGHGGYSQAEHHTGQGHVVLAYDHLGVGDSEIGDLSAHTVETIAHANHAAVREVQSLIRQGELCDGFPALPNAFHVGIGQSMGGCLTIVQQGRHHGYDGIAVLGYSAIHTQPPTRPGATALVPAWLGRDTLLSQPLAMLNADAIAAAPPMQGTLAENFGWAFHFDDVPPEVVARDMAQFNRNLGEISFNEGASGNGGDTTPAPWNSSTIPGAVGQSCMTPGIIASEAAAVTCPVLVAMGERDVCADPKGEVRAYLSANSVDLFICPRMAHMHNFASTRELFWQRIETWADWVRAAQM